MAAGEEKYDFIILAAAPYTVRHRLVLGCSPGFTPPPGVDPALFPVGRYRSTPPSLGIAGPSCTVTGAAVPFVGLPFTEEWKKKVEEGAPRAGLWGHPHLRVLDP